MVQLLVAFHDAVPGCDIQTYIYYIAYEKMGMDRIPPTRLLSDAIFKKLMTDLLEPARRIRTNKRLDIQMFIILTVSYGRWRRQHSTLFSPSVFGTWVNGIASTSTRLSVKRWSSIHIRCVFASTTKRATNSRRRRARADPCGRSTAAPSSSTMKMPL